MEEHDEEYPHVETAMTLMDCGVSDVITTEKWAISIFGSTRLEAI